MAPIKQASAKIGGVFCPALGVLTAPHYSTSPIMRVCSVVVSKHYALDVGL